jgi:hypothetical protein
MEGRIIEMGSFDMFAFVKGENKWWAITTSSLLILKIPELQERIIL